MDMEKILIVEDSEEIRKQLKWGLMKEYDVLFSENRTEATSLFNKHYPKVVLLDLGLPPCENGTEEGFKFLEEILRLSPHIKVIVMTGNAERENALNAVQMGAYDFYQKPISLEELRVIINRSVHLFNIEEENRRLHVALEEKTTQLGGIIGQSPEMLSVFSTIRKIAPSDVSVLITGESGTGKELVARAIHSISLRRDHPFIAINCGAIPENLLESELFGHEKGAFTGAYTKVQGKVEYAHNGTLFLDEIGELNTNLQVKLLRFFQEKIIQRVGGRENIAVDVRMIAATNTDITQAINEEKFREDLYYRIAVVTINLPPLRERGEDIRLLANLFLSRFNEIFKKRIKSFSTSSKKILDSYLWPGNVRELENRVQRAVIMSESSTIEPQDLGFVKKQHEEKFIPPPGMNLKEAKDKLEKIMINSALKKHKGNSTRTAEELGISRPTLYDLLKKHGLYGNFNLS